MLIYMPGVGGGMAAEMFTLAYTPWWVLEWALKRLRWSILYAPRETPFGSGTRSLRYISLRRCRRQVTTARKAPRSHRKVGLCGVGCFWELEEGGGFPRKGREMAVCGGMEKN